MSTYHEIAVGCLPEGHVPPSQLTEYSVTRVDNTKLSEVVPRLAKSLSRNGTVVAAMCEVFQDVTKMVDELKAVAKDPAVNSILQVRTACEDVRTTGTMACCYIDKIACLPRLGTKLRNLACKETTKPSLISDLREFKNIIEEMQSSLSVAEENYDALKKNCDETVRSCDAAQAACARKARKLGDDLRLAHTKKKAVIAGMKVLAAPLIVGGIATIGVGVLTLGIGLPVVVGITYAIARKPVKTAVENITELLSAIDEVPRACSDASMKCASVGGGAFRISRATEDVREDLMRVSMALDEAFESPVYIANITIYQQELIQQSMIHLTNECTNSYQYTTECRITLTVQEKSVAISARCLNS